MGIGVHVWHVTSSFGGKATQKWQNLGFRVHILASLHPPEHPLLWLFPTPLHILEPNSCTPFPGWPVWAVLTTMALALGGRPFTGSFSRFYETHYPLFFQPSYHFPPTSILPLIFSLCAEGFGVGSPKNLLLIFLEVKTPSVLLLSRFACLFVFA